MINIFKLKHIVTLLVLLLGVVSKVFSQQKNHLDVPYISVSAMADTLVTPDRIYLDIEIKEKDSKGKVSVEELENKMAKALEALGINLKKQLLMSDASSNFKSYVFRSKDIQKSKTYELLVYDAFTVAKVMQALEKIDISNVTVTRTEHSQRDKIINGLKVKAIQKAQADAKLLLEAVGQKVGKVLLVEQNMGNVNMLSGRVNGITVASYRSKSVADDMPLEVEFEKLRFQSNVNTVFAIQ